MGLASQKFKGGPSSTPRQAVAQSRPERRRTLRERFAKGEVEWSHEFQRVFDLPRREKPDFGAIVPALTYLLKKPGGTQTLRETQAWGLFEGPRAGGLLGCLAPGSGKTLLGCLMPMVWPHIKNPDGTTRPPRAVLMIPPDLRVQFFADWKRYSEHWTLPNLAGGDGGNGGFNAALPTIHVVAYSELQQPKNTALLEQLRPDLFLCDEVSALRNFEASRTIRVRRFFGDFDASFCGWDATVVDDSLEDFWHFLVWALDDGSPLPTDESEVRRWARAVDPKRYNDGYFMPGELMKLCGSGEEVRAGVHRRIVQTVGIVTSEDTRIGIPLLFKERKVPPIPEDILEHLRKLRRPRRDGGWKRPDGEVLTEAIEVVACARQLGEGFYLRWRYPKGEPIELIDEWFDLRQHWNRELQAQLSSPVVHLDSKALCENAAIRWLDGGCTGCSRGPQEEHRPGCPDDRNGTQPLFRSYTYAAWRDIKDKVYHETEAVWLNDYLLHDAAKWARENVGIVWTDHPEFAERLSALTGLRYYGGGDAAAAELEALYGPEQPIATTSIICSIKSNVRGKNLQYSFSNNLIIGLPASNAMIQQLVGRTFREGQRAEFVRVEYYLHIPELENAFETALERAKFVHETMGTAQMLVYGKFERAAA